MTAATKIGADHALAKNMKLKSKIISKLEVLTAGALGFALILMVSYAIVDQITFLK